MSKAISFGLGFPTLISRMVNTRPFIVVSTRPSNRGKDITVAVLTGQIAKSRRRPRDYILSRWEEANLTEPRAMRPKVFVILKGQVGDRIGRLHDDDRPGLIACLRELFGLE